MKKELPPYHLFICCDQYYIYDTSGCRFYKIEKDLYCLFDLALKHPLDSAIEHFKILPDIDKQMTDAVIATATTLLSSGLEDTPDYSMTGRDYEKISAKVNNSPAVSFQLILTDNCNLSCKYCYCSQEGSVMQKIPMSLETAQRAIDLLFECGQGQKHQDIVFFGGEPFLNFEVIKFCVDYAKSLAEKVDRKLSFRMTSNGTLITDEIAEFVAVNKINIDKPRRSPRAS